MDLNNDDVLLTVKDVATMFGCTTATVYDWVSRNRIDYTMEEVTRPWKGKSPLRKEHIILFQPATIRPYFGEQGYNPDDRLLTANQVGSIMRFSARSVNRAAFSGTFEAIITPTNSCFFRQSYIEEVLSNPSALRPGVPKPPKDRLLKTKEVGQIFRVGSRDILEWIRRKLLPSLHLLGGERDQRIWESVALSYFGAYRYNPKDVPLRLDEVKEELAATDDDIARYVKMGHLNLITTPALSHHLYNPVGVNRLRTIRFKSGI